MAALGGCAGVDAADAPRSPEPAAESDPHVTSPEPTPSVAAAADLCAELPLIDLPDTGSVVVDTDTGEVVEQLGAIAAPAS
jgi:hypothetical protein